MNLAIRNLVISTVNRMPSKGSATSGRLEAREFEWKEKCITYVKSVKMMDSSVGLIICTAHFSETARHC